MKERERLIAHLDREYDLPVRDPLWSHIHLSRPLIELLDTRPFQQLSRIKQLGPSYLVYPGATHTRFSHSLGVFHIARRMIRRLIARPGVPELSLEGLKGFLCAALLHDLGHFPFTHSFKELPLKDHEKLTAGLIMDDPVYRVIRDQLALDPMIPAAIVDETVSSQGRDEILFFRRLLSGSLDPDKLDYLNRDAYYCGVPYGLQDIDFALSRIVPTPDYGIALESDGISAVENILFSKYLMYRAVYWHKTVRAATAMIKNAVYAGLTAGEITPEELYNLDDESFAARFRNDTFPPFRLVDRVFDRRLMKSVIEISFDENNPAHNGLLDLAQRNTVEKQIANSMFGSGNPDLAVILDVPEQIGFEVRFPVYRGKEILNYTEAGTVFTPQVVKDFTRTIRRIRLIIDPALHDRVTDPAGVLREHGL